MASSLKVLPFLFVIKHLVAGNHSFHLEFQRQNDYYIVSIKSGPAWGNADQIRKMRENFRSAAEIIRAQHPGYAIIAVNGCCYGQDPVPDKGDYQKLCGQVFWSFISDGEEELYKEIIEPLGFKAKERNDSFNEAYSAVITVLLLSSIANFVIRLVILTGRS